MDNITVSSIQSGGDKMEGSCDDEEEANRLYPGIPMHDEKVNGCAENRLSVKLTGSYDLLTEDKPPQENDQSVGREMLHGDDDREADVRVCDEDKNQLSDPCSQRLGKATNKYQNCRTSTDLTDPFSLSTVDALLQKDCQQMKNTLLNDETETGLCGSGTVEMLPSLPRSSDCNMEVSEHIDSQSADSSDAVDEQKNSKPADSSVCVGEQKDSQPVDSSDPVYEQIDNQPADSSDPVTEQKDSQPADCSDPVSSEQKDSKPADCRDPVSEQKDSQAADCSHPVSSNILTEQKDSKPADCRDPVSEEKDSQPVDSSYPVNKHKNSQPVDSSDPVSSNPLSDRKNDQPADSSDPVSNEQKDSQPADSSDPVSNEQKDSQPADSSDPVSNNPLSEQKDDQPADSSDPVSSPTNEKLLQTEYKHNQRPLLETGGNIDNTLYNNDRAEESFHRMIHRNKETSKQNKRPRDSDSINSSCKENLVQKECQLTQTALPDGKMETDLCKSDQVESSFLCGTISDKRSSDKKEENQPPSCVDVAVDLNDHFGLSARKLSQVESQHVEPTAVHASDNIKITLHTSGKFSFPDNSNCNKGGNEKNELSSVKPCDPFNLSVEDRLQNDYESVKMKLLELKHKFDKAVCNSDTDKKYSSLTRVNSDEKIKLTQEVKSTAKTDDPFDLSSEDDLYPEKYRPLKRKLCSASKDCNENSHSSRQRAEVDGAAADVVSQAEGVLPKVQDVKKQRTAYRVAYVHSQQLLEKANELIRIKGRAELVHSLISSFGLLQYLQVVSPRCATDAEILGFHCLDYISFLRDSADAPDGEDRHDSDAESYGLSYDCPLQKGIYETCSLISGATIVAAETLISSAADVVINWYGGWHHAKRDSAAGFCYINDIVLGILKLREKFDQILYVDIDLHHGDGVEEAFCMSPKVMTVSFHKYMFGFFPGTGSVTDIGTGRGKYYSVNVPLLDGIKDAEFCAVFYSIMKLVREKFQPQVVVLQCGADTLSSDPMTSFNLTHQGISRCVGLILSWNLPTMLLGGGGYNFPNTAKCWSFLTALAASKKLPLDIPEHENLLAYGPDFEMSTTAGNRKDCNTRQHLANLVAKISRNLSSLSSVGQDVEKPRMLTQATNA